ncbi:MAG: anti-sigma factor [Bryobacteraceae bacterium]|jgi:anti-sigma-K factor RskA
MKTCQEFAELLELYAMGALDGEEKTELEQHLSGGCQVCSEGLKRAGASMLFLATMPEQMEVPSRLRARILASVGAPRPNWGWMAAWAVASAALAITAIWLAGRNLDQNRALEAARAEIRRTAADLANAQLALRFLDEPETKQVVFGRGQPQPPRGSVLLNATRGVLLIATHLPPTPSGKIYELWVIPKGGAPRASGLFQSNAQGDAVYLREGAVDIAGTGAIAVTVEPESGSNAPTTTPIVVAPVSGL